MTRTQFSAVLKPGRLGRTVAMLLLAGCCHPLPAAAAPPQAFMTGVGARMLQLAPGEWRLAVGSCPCYGTRLQHISCLDLGVQP